MPLDINIKIDDKKLRNALSDLAEKDIRRASADAVTRLAFEGCASLREEMVRIFDRPIKHTLNAFYVKPAKRSDLTAEIRSRDYAPKGSAAIDYLMPQIMGGGRKMKKSEIALMQLSGGQYYVPGPGAEMDANGNMKPSQLVQIISRLGAFTGDKAGQNMSEKTRLRLARQKKNARGQRSEYFIGREGRNGRPTGVYKLAGPGHVVAVLWFVKKNPRYRSIFDPIRIVEQAVERHTDRVLASTLRRVFEKRLKYV